MPEQYSHALSYSRLPRDLMPKLSRTRLVRKHVPGLYHAHTLRIFLDASCIACVQAASNTMQHWMV